MLSSDILEEQFGSTQIRILKQTETYRIIQTITENDKSLLEVSFVIFDQTSAYPSIHKKVLDGASIGKAYRDANISFNRNTQSVRRFPMPEKLQSYFNSSEPVTVVEVSASVGPEDIHYCDILEVYHPRVDWPQPATTNDTTQPPNLTTLLELL